MHIIAATFLLPVGVALYTFVGGIKATFLTDYFHTFIIVIILCFFTSKAFSTDEVDSLGNLYELVKAAGARHPVADNHDGSYLTMASKGVSLGGSKKTSEMDADGTLGHLVRDPPHLRKLWPCHCV